MKERRRNSATKKVHSWEGGGPKEKECMLDFEERMTKSFKEWRVALDLFEGKLPDGLTIHTNDRAEKGHGAV